MLLVLAVAALGQAGCQSGPFGGCLKCGGLGVGDRVRTLSERAFRPIRNLGSNVLHGSGGGGGAGCSTCGGGSALGTEAAPLPYGPTTVAPPGTLGTMPMSPGAVDGSTPNIEPIPSAKPEPTLPSGEAPAQGAKSPTGKANYEAFRPNYSNGSGRTNALARSRDASPEPTSRSAKGSTSLFSEPADAGANPLDNLPPLDLPKDQAKVNPSPPPPPFADLEPTPTAKPGPALEAEEPAKLPVDVADKPVVEVTVAPGIRRVSGVDSKLAGGSLPNATGLDWLGEKGYKTILDLREEGEISPTFIAEVAKRGMRFIALPISLKTVDADHVSRFNFEISLADARPLYFCDTDGTRAGVMWYVRRVLVDKVDPQVARRDAEELGLADGPFWLAANAYIDSTKPKPAPSPVLPPDPPPVSPSKPTELKSEPASKPSADANAPEPPTAGPAPSTADASDDWQFRDPAAWKPYAALVVTGLGVPLAFLSRSALPGSLRALTKASLPGPARRPKSLPASSDA